MNDFSNEGEKVANLNKMMYNEINQYLALKEKEMLKVPFEKLESYLSLNASVINAKIGSIIDKYEIKTNKARDLLLKNEMNNVVKQTTEKHEIAKNEKNGV
jgi:hypothetical protein